jgi:hypothetical protein
MPPRVWVSGHQLHLGKTGVRVLSNTHGSCQSVSPSVGIVNTQAHSEGRERVRVRVRIRVRVTVNS